MTSDVVTSDVVQPVDPGTGKKLPPIPAASDEDVARTVAQARAALPGWRGLSPEDRAAMLRVIADELERRAPEIATTITSEMGRVRAESLPEVTKSAAFFRYFADVGPTALAPTPIDVTGFATPEKSAWIRHEARGIVAMIKPWNAPVQQIVWGLAPALMAGCAVIVKPSEFTPGSALALLDAAQAAGLPDGVFSVLPGGPATGRALIEATVDVVAFTGSVATGREIAAVAGRQVRKCILELSGKDALIVDAEVKNLDLVSSGIVYGAFSNCGHWCSSVERALLPEARADEITAAVVAKAERLRVGPGQGSGVDVGPVANRKQFEIVKEIVDDAIARGAEVLVGGHPLEVESFEDGLFFAPTVLRNVPADARLAVENVFGPVVALETYEDVDDAVESANNTNYGLGLSIWTDNADFADYVTARSDTGMVWVNEPLQSLAPCPWSVTKDSGIGAELGVSGLLEFTYEKVVQSQLDGNDGPRPWYFPYD